MAEALISYEFSEQGLRSALEALGTTDAAIVTNLLRLRCFGVRGSDCDCAGAVYVRTVLPDAVKAEVFLDRGDEEPYVVATDAHGRQVDALGSAAFGWFVRRFDYGQHPELVISDASS